MCGLISDQKRLIKALLLACCAAWTIVQSGCAAPVESRPPASYEPGECPISTPEGIEMECGTLKVLENRNDPESQTISVQVAIYKSSSPTPAPDPLVYLSGGPGGSGLLEVRNRLRDFQDILAKRDLISVDQRGTGYSKPSLDCPEYSKAFFDGLAERTFLELRGDMSQAVLDCQKSLQATGIDLSAYTNLENAKDFEDLRLALGYEQWNLMGSSYGTRLALTILREYPKGVRSVILDSTFPPEVEPYSGWVFSLEGAFQTLFDACAAEENCRQTYPNLEKDFLTLVERLDAEPIRVKTSNPITRNKIDVRVDGNTLIFLIFSNLYDINYIPRLPALIESTLDGDTDELKNGLDNYLVYAYGVNWPMYYSVMCEAESGFTTYAQVQEDVASAQVRLAQVMLNEARLDLAICDAWNQPSPESEENRQVKSKVPALILAGEFDPVTPPEWGEHAAEGFRQASFYSLPGMTHGVTYHHIQDNPCFHDLAISFLDDPGADLDDTCIAELPPLEFTLP